MFLGIGLSKDFLDMTQEALETIANTKKYDNTKLKASFQQRKLHRKETLKNRENNLLHLHLLKG